MYDADAVTRWAADPHLTDSIRRWTWCRNALPPLLRQTALAAGALTPAEVDIPALADAFWPWVESLEHAQRFESLDAVDFAHYACGLFLYLCLGTRPLRLAPAERAHEAAALTAMALTLLLAWRQALGAAPLVVKTRQANAAWWASHVENMAEDRSHAVTFLDWISGLNPGGRLPLVLCERPAMLAAMQRRQQGDI